MLKRPKNPYLRPYYLEKYRVDLNSKIQLAEAEELVAKFHRNFPGIAQYVKKTQNDSRTKGNS